MLYDLLDDYVSVENGPHFDRQKRAVSLAIYKFLQIYEALKELNGTDDGRTLFESLLQQRNVDQD